MTDRTQFEQMLEALINEDKSTAQEIFHNIVVAKSREIYEELLENDFGKPDDKGTPDADKGITDDADKDDSEDDFSDKDSTDDMMSDVDSDSDDSDSEGGEGDSDEDVEDRVQDLEDALEDLKAEFEQLMAGEQGEDHMGSDDMGGDDMGGDEFGGEQEPASDDQFGADHTEDESMDNGQTLNVKHTFAEDDERLIREYIEKVGSNW